jgi:3-oxoacyl-[acyl-carrier protein] reductase
MKAAIITGGTRRIGLSIAQALAGAGYALALGYREDEAAAEAARRDLAAYTENVITVKADVGTAAGAQTLTKAALEAFGGVEVLVNNVGPFVPKSLLETDAAEYEMMVQGNLGSVFQMCHAVLPTLRAQGRGVIINLGNVNAEVARGAPNAAVYHALKTAVVVLTKSLARSEGMYGIRANVVNPGMVDTVGVGEGIVKQIPLRRLGEAEDVARAVTWLVSDEAAYVSGAVLNVNGGLWV